MEQLIAFSQPRQTKPISESTKEKRKAYYDANKEKIKQRARDYSKKKYEDPDFKESVRVKNSNYRLILKTAKEMIMSGAHVPSGV
jgi:hypothetical protein